MLTPSNLIYESLLTLPKASFSLNPLLAQDYRVAPSGKMMTFTIPDGIYWHDGVPFTAEDVKFSLEAALSPEHNGPLSAYSGLVERVETPDQRTVIVRLKEPYCPLLTELGLVKILPRHIYASAPIPSHQKAIGTGPFRLVRWDESGCVLESFGDYHGGDVRAKRWIYRRFKTREALLEALREGDIDLAVLEPDEAALLEGERILQLFRYPSMEFYFIAFNNEDPVLEDVQVRKALSLALDRKHILAEVLGGEGVLIGGPFPPGYLGADDPPIPRYDPVQARRLLLEAGWVDKDGLLEKGGEPLQISVAANGENPLRTRVAMLVAQYYRAIGIDAEVHIVEWGTLLEMLFKQNFQAAVFSWPIGPDLDLSPFFSSQEREPKKGFNFVSYVNPRVDALLEEGLRAPSCDPVKRADICNQLVHILAEERPYDFLFMPYTIIATNSPAFLLNWSKGL